MKVRVGDTIKLEKEDVAILGLFRDGVGDEYIKYSTKTGEVQESSYTFKKRLLEPLTEMDV